MPADPVTLLGLLVAAVGFVVLVERLVVSTPLALGLVLASTLHNQLFGSFGVDLAGINVGIDDAVFGAIGIAGVARLLRSRRLPPLQVLTLVFAALVGWSLVRGVLGIGPFTAINESRKYVYLVSALLFFVPIDGDDTDFRDVFARMWVGLAVVLTGLAFLRWGANAVGVVGGIFGDGDGFRVLNARGTILVFQGALISFLANRDHAPRWLVGASPWMFSVAFLLQHRTVWVIMLLALAVVVARNSRLSRRLVVLVVGGAVALVLLTVTVFAGRTVELESQLTESATSTGTFEWRVETWRVLVFERSFDTPEVALGKPFGSGWERRMFGQTWDASPHNFLVESLLRTGIAGVVVIGAWHVLVFRRTSRRRIQTSLLPDEAILALMISLAVSYLTYSPSPDQGVLLAVATAAAIRRPAVVVPGARPLEIAA